jgi:7-cyano-7-deazaguanine synthase in queuosine biosynthesis
MKYNLDIKFTEFKPIHKRYSHSYDCVILFSGGFDSTAAFLKALDEGLNPLLLWVGFGQKNEEIEYQKVKNISKKIKYPVSIVKINLGGYIEEGWKDWDYIIPARNFMFVCLAASFLSSSKKKKVKIYLSAHEEEIKKENTDKSREFFKGCNYLFSKFYNKGFKVGTPFEKYSKSEISAYWKNKWMNKYNISPYETTTCYYGNTCGRCKACLKRSISLLVGGFELDPDIKENPFEDKDGFISKDFFKRFNKFPLKRKIELIIALDKSLASLPQEV